MISLRQHLNNYLTMRRALGFRLLRGGKALAKFTAYVEQSGVSYITTAMALTWAQQPSSAQPATWAARLTYVRGFARYMSAFDSRTEIPSMDLLPHRPKRARPYIYTDQEIQKLMCAAMNLPICCQWPAASKFKRHTYYYLIGLLSVTGMRIGEAIHLKNKDVDLNAGVLTIEGSKFGKSRFVPLHASTVAALLEYASVRNRYCDGNSVHHFFVNMVGNVLDPGTVRRTFYELSRKIGIRKTHSSKGPRIHDLRHRFALHTLLQWYQNGEDAERMLPILSTYLGHVHVSDTYWYLTAYPELMRHAAERLERRWEVLS